MSSLAAVPDREHLPPGRMLAPAFFRRPSEEVAPELIGKILWRRGVGGGRLTEVEAYLLESDPACHAARGRTRRNTSMFASPGTIYVYLSYGIHVLLNLVCEDEGVGSAVLIRSFEPMGDDSGLARNRARRGSSLGGLAREVAPPPALTRRRTGGDVWLSCGPGRVGQALGLDLGFDGLPLGETSRLYVIEDGWRGAVGRSTRIGISKGSDLPLRYYMVGSACVGGEPRQSGGKK